jgi:hypothetical protein
MNKERARKISGWAAIVIAGFFASAWAFWGIMENFHEGWYFRSLGPNIVLMFGQYLAIPILFTAATAVSIMRPRAGSLIHLTAGVLAVIFFGRGAGVLFIGIPFVGLALLYWFGKVDRKKLACLLAVGPPLLIILGFGTSQAIRVAGRFHDDVAGARRIEGNGVALTWAPTGPGWPDAGTTWENAVFVCSHLSEDGTTLADKELNFWRLPTVDEAVRSMVRHGTNAGGVWTGAAKTASYKKQPDKESPLWNAYSKVIYWWTADEVDARRAYIVVYNGTVWPRLKTLQPAYLAFRAVRTAKP